LHDFRVSLRRLRSWIRAFDHELKDSIKRKHRRRLRKLSQDAGASRDAEVHVAWLRDVEKTLAPNDRPGAAWLLDRLRGRQHDADSVLRELVASVFSDELAALTKDLAEYTVRVDLRNSTPVPTLADAIAPLIQQQATALGERLTAVQSIQDQATAHAARIAGKRLRYLVEPIADGVAGGPELVKRLKQLQDTIGEMHDVHVLADEVIDATQDAGAEQGRRIATALLDGAAGDDSTPLDPGTDPRPGLLAIATRLRERGMTAFAELEAHWIGPHATELPDEARAIAARLRPEPQHAVVVEQERAMADEPPAETPINADYEPVSSGQPDPDWFAETAAPETEPAIPEAGSDTP
jgi:CHAD domain-containing protein